MVKIERVYAPGACNISPQEGTYRLISGLIGTGLTIAAALAFFSMGVPWYWRLTLFFPAMMAASGFLQATMKFCLNYGMRGVYNVTADVGVITQVADENKRTDKRRALVILGYSLAIAAAVAAVGALIPMH